MEPIEPPVPPRVAFIAHCLINQNAKVDHYARRCASIEPIVTALRRHGYQLQQLPCPEMLYAGVGRWWASKEILDKASYREHCARLSAPVAAQIQEYYDRGWSVVLIGSDGSPSSGVRFTGTSPRWGGRPEGDPSEYRMQPGMGVWMEELERHLVAAGHAFPPATGVLLDDSDFDWERDMPGYVEELDRFLANPADQRIVTEQR